MSRKDISTILKKGSAKQRAVLLANSIANSFTSGEAILTDREHHELIESFKTDSEIRVYSKFRRADEVVRNALMYLSQLWISYREQVAHITGYALLWDAYQRSEDMINELFANVENKKQRAKLLEIASKYDYYFLAKVEPDEENFIHVNTGKPRKAEETEGYSLEDIIHNFSRGAGATLGQVKAVIKALKEYMSETGFNVKAYKDMIKEVETDAKQDKAVFPKYSKRQTAERGIARIPDKYFVYPMYEDVEIDEAFYTEFKEKYL